MLQPMQHEESFMFGIISLSLGGLIRYSSPSWPARPVPADCRRPGAGSAIHFAQLLGRLSAWWSTCTSIWAGFPPQWSWVCRFKPLNAGATGTCPGPQLAVSSGLRGVWSSIRIACSPSGSWSLGGGSGSNGGRRLGRRTGLVGQFRSSVRYM
jgi:hypothetical protein